MEVTEEILYDLADLFRVFGDSTRVRILYALLDGEQNVSDLAQIVSQTQSAVSHQLRILKTAKLIRSRREGKQVIYALADEHVSTLLNIGIEHITE